MDRRRRIGVPRPGRLFGGLLLVAGAGLGLAHLPELLSGWSVLRVAEVRVEGARYLGEAEAVEVMGMVGEVSMFDDMEPYRERLRAHSLVREVTLRRRPFRTVMVEVEEREPVALLPTPTLVPVDAEGRILPLDPAGDRLDLPVLRASGWEDPAELEREDLPVPGRVTRELDRLARMDPDFAAAVSEVGWADGDVLMVRMSSPPVVFQLPVPLADERLREGMLALADAVAEGRGEPRAVDLRYEDQVVVRFHSRQGQ